MTKNTRQQHQQDRWVAQPVVRTPEDGQSYYSPLSVSILPGTGGTDKPTRYMVEFRDRGPTTVVEGVNVNLNQPLPLGPHELHTFGQWYSGGIENVTSEWVINTFFVLTPPAS